MIFSDESADNDKKDDNDNPKQCRKSKTSCSTYETNKILQLLNQEFWDNYQYPLLQGIFLTVDGQYDPAEQNTSLVLKISAQVSAPPQVWFGSLGGS